MILKNKRGLKGQATEPVVLPRNFLNALFNIEKNYTRKDTFSIIHQGEKREHHLNHITNADLQVATILLKACTPVKGVLQQVNPHSIYARLSEYYEKPISLSQFYSSLKKFKLHNLISETYTLETGLYNYQINHFSGEAGDKIDFFALLHPVVFTAAFNKLSLPQKKLFYSVCLQQGGGKGKEIERKLVSDKEDVQFSGLCHFLHRKDPYFIRVLLEEMKETLVEGQPLFETAYLVKQGKRYHKAVLSIHPGWLLKKEDGKEYHDMIPIPLVHKRKANFIEKLLHNWGIADILSLNNGHEFARLVRFLKNYGYRVIRFAIYRLKQFVDQHLRFPADILYYILKEVRFKTEAVIIDIAVKTKVVDYIAPGLNAEERKDREFEFASNLSYYGPKAIEKACKAALPRLELLYAAPVHEKLGIEDYVSYPWLNQVNSMDIIRRTAWRECKDVRSYAKLEAEAVERYHKKISHNALDAREFTDWMLRKVYELPAIETVPDTPSGFKLEDFLVQRQILQVN